MESSFIHGKIADKISQLLGCEIPAETFVPDNIQSSCGRLFYDGTNCSNEKMERSYKFRFRWYDEDWNVPLNKIHTVENFFREAVPEIFSDGNNIFPVRNYKINSSSFERVNISAMLFYCAELNFSVIV